MVRRSTVLVLAGLLTETIYLVAAWRLPWSTFGGGSWNWVRILGVGTGTCLACLAGVLALMAAYLWGWRLVRTGGGVRPVVWAFALVFAATLFCLLPMTCDLFNYLTKAHLFTDLGANPLLEAPADSWDAMLLAYPAAYAEQTSIYGPVWVMLSGLGTLGAHDELTGLLYLKALAAGAYLAAVWLLERILRQVRPDSADEALYLFAWNPLVLLMAVGDGHNDMVMMALILLSIWLLLRERWNPAFGLLALSAWVKYAGLILLPLFALYAWRQLGQVPVRTRWFVLGRAILAFALVTAAVFAPFGEVAGILRIGERLLHPANWQWGSEHVAPRVLGVGLLMFFAAYGLLLLRLRKSQHSFQPFGNAGFAALLLVLVFGVARSQPWHLIWPATLAGLSDRRWAWPAVIGLSGILLLAQVWIEWGMPGVHT